MREKAEYGWMKHLDFMAIDLLSLFGMFFLAFYMKFGNLDLNARWVSILLIIMLLQIVINLLMNPYSGILRRSFFVTIGRAGQMALTNLLITTLFIYVMKYGDSFSREVMLETFIFYMIVSLLLKYFWRRLLLSGKVRMEQNKLRTLVIVGNGETLERTLKDATAADFQEYDIKAITSVDGFEGIEGSTVDSFVDKRIDISGLEKYVLENRIDEVMVAVDPKRMDRKVISRLIDNGINIHVNVESLFDLKPDDQFISRIGICQAVTMGVYGFTPKQRLYLGFKRLLDIIFGLLGCLFLLPIMGIVKFMNITSGDHEKIFYKQNRVGKNGKLFRMVKFRSMVPNADEILKEMLKDPVYSAEWAENQKFENDPRITKAGKILRKTSLDEWPQFINVLKGDMSVVGPRPLIVSELEDHDGLQLYNRVRPGVTGWWGCNGRSNIDYKERLDLEYHYIKHIGLSIDAICILRTIGAVFSKNGAK